MESFVDFVSSYEGEILQEAICVSDTIYTDKMQEKLIVALGVTVFQHHIILCCQARISNEASWSTTCCA